MKRIHGDTVIIMIGLAIVFDAISLVPLLGTIGDLFASFIFGIWFSHHGFSSIKERPLGFLGTILIEAIPFLDMFPTWTIYVVTTIWKINKTATV